MHYICPINNFLTSSYIFFVTFKFGACNITGRWDNFRVKTNSFLSFSLFFLWDIKIF